MSNQLRTFTKLLIVGLPCTLGLTGVAEAAAFSVSPLAAPGGASATNPSANLPVAHDDANPAVVVDAHLYLNFAPSWLKMLGRSSESAENMRGTGHYDVGAIRRRDSSSYELTIFYVDNGLDSVRQGLEKSCTTSGGRVDDKTGAASHVVYCLAPAA
jgi:hypothetical protein